VDLRRHMQGRASSQGLCRFALEETEQHIGIKDDASGREELADAPSLQG
jgi:hypothetical protein